MDIRPVQNTETRIYDSLDFKITFLSNQKSVVDNELANIKRVFVEGHKHIEDIFRSSLTEKYWETIK